jgi:hypothetical protein
MAVQFSRGKHVIFMALIPTIFAVSLAHAASMSPREPETDRPGGDYTHFSLPDKNYILQCEDSCGGDTRCVAWNFDTNPPGTPEKPECFLKSSVQPPIKRGGTISGVKIRE